MPFLTMDEYENSKLYEIDDAVYKQIERAFVKALGERMAMRLLEKFLEKTVREISANSYVNVLETIIIL